MEGYRWENNEFDGKHWLWHRSNRAVDITHNWNTGQDMEPADDFTFGSCFHNGTCLEFKYLPDGFSVATTRGEFGVFLIG